MMIYGENNLLFFSLRCKAYPLILIDLTQRLRQAIQPSQNFSEFGAMFDNDGSCFICPKKTIGKSNSFSWRVWFN